MRLRVPRLPRPPSPLSIVPRPQDSACANLYVAENGGNRVRKVALSTATVNTIAGGGSATGTTAGWVDGVGTASLLWGPTDIAVDSASNTLYIGDYTNLAVRAVALGRHVQYRHR